MSDERRMAPDDDDDVATRIVAILKVAAPLAVVFLAIGMGVVRGAPIAILILAAGALAAGIALFWQSVRTLVGETPLSGADAFAIAAPRAEEEKKRAVLRALKDLEFERSVGKISSEDYDQLVLSYRAEARALLQQIDEGAKPRRDRVLALVEDRLRKAGLAGGMGEVRALAGSEGSKGNAERSESGSAAAAVTESAAETATETAETATETAETATESAETATESAAETAAENADPSAAEKRATCSACSASNEIDAAFCKKCGAKMTKDEPARDSGAEAESDAT